MRCDAVCPWRGRRRVPLAVGERLDVDAATEYPPGSFYVTAADAPHYSYAVTDVIVQEQGVGPTGIAYVHPGDDPRHGR